MKYREDIDFLRGVAVLLVVVFHAFPELLSGGFIGVDVFFVISGYLISRLLLADGQIDILKFYDRRIRRILPAFISVIAFCLLLGWLVLYPDEYQSLGSHASYASLFILNFQLISEIGYFNQASALKPLLHFWTLSVEEQFYLVWPIFIVMLLSLKNGYHVLRTATLSIVLSSLAFSVIATQLVPEQAYFHSLARVWQLGVGALLALFASSIPRRGPWLGYVGLSMILLGAMLIESNDPYPGWLAIVPTFGAAFFISANLKVKPSNILIKIGLISYPLYLWHWVLLSFSRIYTGRQLETGATIIIVTTAVIFAMVSNRYLEPIRYKPQTWISPLLIGILILVVGVGWNVAQDGYPNRKHMEAYAENIAQLKRSDPTDEECLAFVNRTLGKQPLFNYCRSALLENTDNKVAIIGDSHALALFRGFKAPLQDRGFGIIAMANSSCPPFLGFPWFNKRISVEECQTKIRQIIDVLKLDPGIKKVIVATRGPMYFHGEVDPPYTVSNVAIANSRIEDTGLNLDMLIKSFATTVKDVSATRMEIEWYYVLENPELGFDPRTESARPFDYYGLSLPNDGVDREAYELRMKQYFDRFYKMGEEHSVTIVPSGDYLCTQDKCPVLIEGKLAYYDDDHLSEHGAKVFAERSIEIFFKTEASK